MTKVLYFLGKGRVGSTLLDNVLGQLDGFVSVGELRHLWDWGLDKGWACGCGSPFPDCPFWSSVMSRVFGEKAQDAALMKEILLLQEEVLRWPRVPRLLSAANHGTKDWASLDQYVNVQSKIYAALADVSGAEIIVDSTKWPASPTALGLVPGVDVYLIHLVRDPRAVVYAWKKHKLWTDRPGGQEMPRFGTLYSMASWWSRSVVAELVSSRIGPARSLVLRYEDFVARPREALWSILDLLDEPRRALPLTGEGKVSLKPTHSVGGNPTRSSTGEISLRLDDEWVTGQRWSERLTATTMALPFLFRYGYRVFPRTSTS